MGVLMFASYCIGAFFSLWWMRFLFGTRIYSDRDWHYVAPGWYLFHPAYGDSFGNLIVTAYETVVFGTTLFILFRGLGWLFGRVKHHRILFGLIAFPVTITFALACVVGYNMVAHRQGVFAQSAFWGNITYMRITYSLGADVNAPGCRYRTCYPPLVEAVYGDRIEAVEFLLERGANVNVEMNGTTPLMAASATGNGDIVRLLISNGADVNVDRDEGDAPGDTALKIAKLKGHHEVVELLKQAGAVDTP